MEGSNYFEATVIVMRQVLGMLRRLPADGSVGIMFHYRRRLRKHVLPSHQ